MEEMWKKFKEETKGDIEKIMGFLKESSMPSCNVPNNFQPKPIERIEHDISQQIVLDENSQTGVPASSGYGSLTNIVKELMGKEKISRAQAYRRAKKMISEKSQQLTI